MAINDRPKITHKRTKVLIYGRLLKKSRNVMDSIERYTSYTVSSFGYPANYSLALNASHFITVNLPKSRN